MALNPVPVIAYIIGSRVLTALITSTTAAVEPLPECTGFVDIITGCASWFSYVLSVFLGTIPGAPGLISTVVVTITNLLLLWSILTLARGT